MRKKRCCRSFIVYIVFSLVNILLISCGTNNSFICTPRPPLYAVPHSCNTSTPTATTTQTLTATSTPTPTPTHTSTPTPTPTHTSTPTPTPIIYDPHVSSEGSEIFNYDFSIMDHDSINKHFSIPTGTGYTEKTEFGANWNFGTNWSAEYTDYPIAPMRENRQPETTIYYYPPEIIVFYFSLKKPEKYSFNDERTFRESNFFYEFTCKNMDYDPEKTEPENQRPEFRTRFSIGANSWLKTTDRTMDWVDSISLTGSNQIVDWSKKYFVVQLIYKGSGVDSSCVPVMYLYKFNAPISSLQEFFNGPIWKYYPDKHNEFNCDNPVLDHFGFQSVYSSGINGTIQTFYFKSVTTQPELKPKIANILNFPVFYNPEFSSLLR